MAYKAFISYSHVADENLASALQAGLQRFAKSWFKLRAMRIFRDKTSLSVDPRLWSQIETALLASEYFILLASPRSAASRWVQAEAAYWITTRSGKNLLVVLTEGKLVWNQEQRDFDWDRTDALPPQLRGCFGEEPLYLDLRWAGTSEDLSLENPRFRDTIADIAATLRGISKDELVGEDVRQHRRTRRLAWSAVSVLAVLLVAATSSAVIALWQRQEAVRQRERAEEQTQQALKNAKEASRQKGIADANATEAQREAQIAQERQKEAEEQKNRALSRQLAAQAELLRGGGVDLLDRALLLAVEASRRWLSWETHQSLLNSLGMFPSRDFDFPVGSPVDLVQFSPDGRYLASLSKSGDVRIWELNAGRDYILDQDGGAHALAFSADGHLLATGANNGWIRIYAVPGLSELRRFSAPKQIRKMLFGSNNKTFVSISANGQADVWDPTTGEHLGGMSFDGLFQDVAIGPTGIFVAAIVDRKWVVVHEVMTGRELLRAEPNEYIVAVTLSPDARLAASVSHPSVRPGSLKLWDLASGRQLRSIEPIKGALTNVAFSPNGRYVAVSSDGYGGATRVWETDTGQVVSEMLDGGGDYVVFDADSRWLATSSRFGRVGSTDYSVRIWEVNTGQLRARMANVKSVWSIAFSPDGERVATSDDSSVRVYPAVALPETARIMHQDDIEAVTFSPDAKFIATVSRSDARLYDVSGIPHSPRLSLVGASDVAFSPNGQYFAAACADGVARVWDIGTGQELFHVRYDQQRGMVRFSPDSKYLLSASTGNVMPLRYVVVLSAVPTGNEIWRHSFDWWVSAITFSRDSRYVVASAHDVANVWIVATGREIQTFRADRSISGLDFTPDGASLAIASWDGTARIWSMATGQEVAQFRHSGQVLKVAFSPDGALLATISFHNPVRVWRVSSRKELQALQHENDVRSIEFSPDGKYLASASMDHTARIWDANSGLEVARFALPDEVNAVAFDYTGSYLATGSSDNSVRIWRWRPEELWSEACRRLIRNFTMAEWRQYVGDAEPYRKTCPNLP